MEELRGGEPKRKKQEIPVDYNFIMPLFLKGKGFSEIATILAPLRAYRVDYKTVYKDVHNVLKQWRLERLQMIDEQMDIDLKKIDHLEAVYWEAWEKSCKAKVKTVQKERSMFDKSKKQRIGDLTNQQAEKHVTEVVGDKSWLEGVQWCIMQRAALLQYKKVTQPGVDDPLPIVGDIIFETVTRKNNDQYQDAVEITETPEEGMQKLLQS